MQNETKIHLRPWIGSEYEKGIGGKRLLVLGESQYSDTDNPELTQIVMKKLLAYKLRKRKDEAEYEPWMRTFTIFERAVAGRVLSGEESAAFWNSVLFYNFVQEMMPDRGFRPTRKQFADSAAAFEEVLNAYEPDLIIAWGKTLFDRTPELAGRNTPSIMHDKIEIYTYEYTLRSGKMCRMMRMLHPAAPGYSKELWHEVIAEFLA